MENGLESIGPPKAVWQVGDSSVNVYNEFTPSEIGITPKLKANLLQRKL